MKANTKRMVSVLLALVLCFSMLPAAVLQANAATVNYVTGDPDGFSNVIKNWGTRGTDATFLSPNAEAFYTDTTYEALSALAGSTSTSSVPSSALYLALQELMEASHSTETTYAQTKSLFAYTDCQENGSVISSFYSGASIGPDWDSGSTWNREHTWPNSKGLGGNDENDIMMLRPTAINENSSRGNTAYGESSGYYDPNSVSGNTYNLHGDVARIMLYVYVRWGNTSYMWGSSGVMESLDVLLKWMEEDPVDTWEMGRNDSVESITGTRNVFVDYPELAFLLFGQAVPEMITPSGIAAEGEYAITATVNDASMGSVSVSGKTITAYPAEGYQVEGYTLVSGDATVTQSGNIFTVNAASDCTVCINFSARTALQVTVSENGSTVSLATAYAGDTYTIPSHSGELPQGTAFLGWVTEPVTETNTKPEQIYVPGTEYTLTGNITFYALYYWNDGEEGTTTGIYAQYTGDLTEGDYLIVYDGCAMKAELTTKPRLYYQEVEIADGLINEPDALLIWHIAAVDDGLYTIYNEGNGYVASTGSSTSTATLVSSVTSNAQWSCSGSETYDFCNAYSGHYLRKNATYGFACYTTSIGGALTLYRAVEGTICYTTAIACDHENTVTVAALEATCTEPGYTAGVYCEDCGQYISGHEEISATGHSWDEGTVTLEATFEDVGEKEYICTVCGATKTEEYEKPLIDLEGSSMILGDSLSLAFVIDITQLEEDGAYAYITRSYANGTEAVKLRVEQADWVQYSGDLYYFSFDGIAAKEMGDTLQVEVYNTFGTQISNPYEDSIRDYAMRLLEQETDAKLCTLLVDMLNYGAAAQAQFGYNTGDLVNADLTEAQKACATASVTTESALRASAGRAGTALTLKNRITLDFIFKNSAIGSDYTGLYAVAVYTDHYGNAVQTRIDTVRAFTASMGYVSVPGLAVADYGQSVTCTVYDAEGNVLAWATDSVEGYAHRMQGSLPDMVEAIVKFGASSYSYFH